MSAADAVSSGRRDGTSAVPHGGTGQGDAGHAPHGTARAYLIGFGLSVVLTAIPFWLVMGNVLNDTLRTSLVVMAFAAVQIVVHMVCFLHMNTKSEGGWTFIALVFTLTLVMVTLAGSIWVMHHMDANMMPLSAHDARIRP